MCKMSSWPRGCLKSMKTIAFVQRNHTAAAPYSHVITFGKKALLYYCARHAGCVRFRKLMGWAKSWAKQRIAPQPRGTTAYSPGFLDHGVGLLIPHRDHGSYFGHTTYLPGKRGRWDSRLHQLATSTCPNCCTQ